jgi:methyl-accepting chemotaxis protein
MTQGPETEINVRRVLNRSLFLPVVLMAAVGALLFAQVNQLVELTNWVDHTDKVIANANRVERLLVDRESGLRGYLSTGVDGFLDPYTQASNELPAALERMESFVADNRTQTRRAARLRQLAGRWESEFARVTLERYRRNEPISLDLRLVGKRFMDEVRALLADFNRDEVTLRDQRTVAVREAVRRGTLVGALLILGVAAVLALFTRRQFTVVTSSYDRSLALSRERAQELAESERQLSNVIQTYGAFITSLARGDLTASVEPTGEGDLRQLGGYLGAMGTYLRTTTQRVNEAVAAIVSASTEILATTQQQGAGAAESAAAVTETVATVDEVAQTSHQTADRANAVASAARRSVEVSSSGRESVDRTVRAMERVRVQVGAIAERILALSDQAQTVGQIVTTVNELAEQSNLLALNAAIEAARAGDQGRGFAVVAQEVRSLAEQSKRATGQIRGILNEIQKSTTAAVLATEEGGKAVASAVEAVQGAGERIEQLAGTISDAAGAAQQIVAAAQQQVTGIGQISQAMRSIDQATTQAVEGTRQSERAARDLNDLAARLRDTVAQYRT